MPSEFLKCFLKPEQTLDALILEPQISKGS